MNREKLIYAKISIQLEVEKEKIFLWNMTEFEYISSLSIRDLSVPI